jgi:transcriptional regulator with XRE-family HTH domain
MADKRVLIEDEVDDLAGFDTDDWEDLDDFVEEQAQDPEFVRGLEDAEARAVVLKQLIAWRKECGMSQAAAAAMMGTTQSAISELEGGETDPCLSTLQRYARSIGSRITLGVVPPDDHHFVERKTTTTTTVVYAESWTAKSDIRPDYLASARG